MSFGTGGLRVEDEIAEIVQVHGWYAASVSDHDPPFLYTIGLMQTFNHPEFIVFGLDPANAHVLFSQLVQDIRAGRSYGEPNVYQVNIGGENHRIGVRPVHVTQHPLYLGFAMGYCRHIGRWGELEAMQVFWPDSSGRFPFDAGCAEEVFQLQPRLDIALTPAEQGQWRRQWE